MLNSHDSLENYYHTNFTLMYSFEGKKFDPLLWDEKLLPFEKALYLDFLQRKVEEASGSGPPKDQWAAPQREEVDF